MRSFKVDFNELERDVEELEARLTSEVDISDLRHTKFWEEIGKCCTVSGFILAAFASPWLIPLAALLMVQGMACRAFVAHHTGHSAYDSIPGAEKYSRAVWGVGKRRFIDCFCLQSIEEDRIGHDKHHQYTNTRKDPNAVRTSLRMDGVNGKVKREMIFWVGIFTWIWQYYAPSFQEVNTRVRPFAVFNFSMAQTIRYWVYRVLPYVTAHFVLLPLMFAPWGIACVLQVLMARLLADMLLGLYMFSIGVTNHVGKDLYEFSIDTTGTSWDSKGEWYLQQILSTTSFASPNDFTDYLHCFMNYQIEHHLMPNLPPSKYKKARHEVQLICLRHNIPYVEESIFKRFLKTKDIFLDTNKMRTYVKQNTIR